MGQLHIFRPEKAGTVPRRTQYDPFQYGSVPYRITKKGAWILLIALGLGVLVLVVGLFYGTNG